MACLHTSISHKFVETLVFKVGKSQLMVSLTKFCDAKIYAHFASIKHSGEQGERERKRDVEKRGHFDCIRTLSEIDRIQNSIKL